MPRARYFAWRMWRADFSFDDTTEFAPWLATVAHDVRRSAVVWASHGNAGRRGLSPTRSSGPKIEAIRGVQCGEVLRQLIERDLVRITGRSEELDDLSSTALPNNSCKSSVYDISTNCREQISCGQPQAMLTAATATITTSEAQPQYNLINFHLRKRRPTVKTLITAKVKQDALAKDPDRDRDGTAGQRSVWRCDARCPI